MLKLITERSIARKTHLEDEDRCLFVHSRTNITHHDGFSTVLNTRSSWVISNGISKPNNLLLSVSLTTTVILSDDDLQSTTDEHADPYPTDLTAIKDVLNHPSESLWSYLSSWSLRTKSTCLIWLMFMQRSSTRRKYLRYHRPRYALRTSSLSSCNYRSNIFPFSLLNKKNIILFYLARLNG